METKQIAEKLVAYVRDQSYQKAYDELYSDDIVSIETSSFGNSREDTGMEAVEEKAKEWQSEIKEIHKIEVSEPLVAHNSFAITMMMDCTNNDGNREAMTELAVYQVKDGKIVREEFIY